ncbi:hypothetical protein [Nocardioides houyundeii]|uniref:hypothetical protein n=1 Tax=Nocardioides houyundeii TaxID=2045452 RepID=UPI000DF4C2F9|nr:hypothetical protein [Nocardioides houyundeii]
MNARGLGLMVTALLTALLTTLLGSQAATAASLEAAAPPDNGPRFLEDYPSFSPNGDGDHDRLEVGYQLRVGAVVQIRVEPRTKVAPFTVALGWKPAGRHTWRWNGRTPQGRLVPEGLYEVHLLTPQGRAESFASLDLTFESGVFVSERFGAPRDQVSKVYPRSVAVRDGVRLFVGRVSDGEVRSGVVTFRNASGGVVLRRDLRSLDRDDELIWEGRDSRGRPLPPGRYLATVSGVDRLGNEGASKPLRLWVSQDRLVRRQRTRVLTAQKAWISPCSGSTTPECQMTVPGGEVTPSVRLAGGLTHRAEPSQTFMGRARSQHFLAVPKAVRGVDAIRVAFAGEPTNPGGTDVGHLSAGAGGPGAEAMVSSGSTGRTRWVEDPVYGDGVERSDRDRRRLPGAYWEFWTEGDDAFDVGTFTVSLRYLAVAG